MACERGPVAVAAPAGTAEVTVMALITPTVDTRASNLVAARSSLTTVSSRCAKFPGTHLVAHRHRRAHVLCRQRGIGHLLWRRQ